MVDGLDMLIIASLLNIYFTFLLSITILSNLCDGSSNEINTQLPPRYSIMNDGTLMIENIEYDDLGTFECIGYYCF